jgi:predicted GH43/DUF377 family glycosyl hydrolase
MQNVRPDQAQSLLQRGASWVREMLTGTLDRTRRDTNSLKWHYDILTRHTLSGDFYNSGVENVFLIPQGILVFFHATTRSGSIRVFADLFEAGFPDHSLFEKPKEIYTIGDQKDGWKFIQLQHVDDSYVAYWSSPKHGTREYVYPQYIFKGEVELRQALPLLEKPIQNPILSPASHNTWEAFCTFNPAAVYANDQVHLLYRAQGHDYVSQIGYASSSDGVTIETRLEQPAYRPSQPFEGFSQPLGDPDNPFVSGGGCGGCEDPRATIIDDRVYMTYVAYNGWDHPRVAMTSIDLDDFLAQRFLWEKPVLISQPGVVDKSACIFPEKVNGKYVIMHRVFPDILIDYVDSLDFTGEQFLEGHTKISPRSREWWDSRKIGAGAPPLKTKEGWLLIYQAVDDKDASEYKIGAMLLDLNDPSKVLYRCSQPILEPREVYENNGFKAGVVYPCGAVIKDDTLFVYYGGADSYVCVATANVPEFLNQLKKTGHPRLDPATLGLSGQPKRRRIFSWHK